MELIKSKEDIEIIRKYILDNIEVCGKGITIDNDYDNYMFDKLLDKDEAIKKLYNIKEGLKD